MRSFSPPGYHPKGFLSLLERGPGAEGIPGRVPQNLGIKDL